MSAEKIRHLKLLISNSIELAPHEMLTCQHFSQGVPRGCVVELTGHGKTQWLIDFFLQHPEHQIFWVEKKQTLLPTALSQRGLSIQRIDFINSTDDLYIPLRRALQSQIYTFVVGPSEFDAVKTLQSLQLLTEKTNSTLFLLARSHKQAWPIAVQLEVDALPKSYHFEVHRFKIRGRE